jgi:hypothetical protein
LSVSEPSPSVVEALHVLLLRPHERVAAVGEDDIAPRLRQRDGRLRRRVAPADHDSLLIAAAGGVEQAVLHVVLVLPRHVEAPEVAAPPDRHDHALPPNAGAVRRHDRVPVAVPLHVFGLRVPHRDVAGLPLQLVDEVLLRLRRHLNVALRRHLLRVGIDRLAGLEVPNGGKPALRLQDAVGEPVLLRLSGGSHPAGPRADDHDVVRTVLILRLHRVDALRHDVLHGPRAAVHRKLEQGHARQVAHHVNAVDIGAEVVVHLGQFFGRAGGPLEVQPVGIAGERMGHGGRTRAENEVGTTRGSEVRLCSSVRSLPQKGRRPRVDVTTCRKSAAWGPRVGFL